MPNSHEQNYIETDDDLSQSEQRNKKYTTLVQRIITDNNVTQIFKYIFFVIVCLVFVSVSIIGILVVYKVAQKEVTSYTDLGIAISGLGGVLSVIIVLPKIIAKHLFPENSEKVRFDFVSQNQKYDLGQPDLFDDYNYGVDDGELEEMPADALERNKVDKGDKKFCQEEGLNYDNDE